MQLQSLQSILVFQKETMPEKRGELLEVGGATWANICDAKCPQTKTRSFSLFLETDIQGDWHDAPLTRKTSIMNIDLHLRVFPC